MTLRTQFADMLEKIERGNGITEITLGAEYKRRLIASLRGDDWIPVDEALPEISTPLDQKFVWVYVPDLPYGYGPDKCQHLGCRYDQIGWRVVGSNTDRVVTHWRPLPGTPA